MTIDTNYSFHSNCTHESTKVARNRCRRQVRRALDSLTVKELQAMARGLDLEGRSKADKATLVHSLSFAPAVRETITA
jgi:hypothetical protein